MIGFGLSLWDNSSGAGASPAALFANGEQGLWISPSDISTLFQDSIGTTKVTAFGQPVGLSLDHSKAMMPGPELLSGSWTLLQPGTSTATEVPAGQLNLTGDGTNTATGDMSIATVVGATYKITASVSGTGSASMVVGIVQGGSTIISTLFTTGSNTATFVATAATTWIRFGKSSASTVVVTTISARQVTHLGSERITNGTFTSGTGWTTSGTGAATTFVGNVATVTEDGVDGTSARMYQTIPTIAGETYLLSVGINCAVGNGLVVLHASAPNIGGAFYNSGALGTGSLRLFTTTFVAQSTNTYVIFDLGRSTAASFAVSTVSVRQIIRDGSEMNSILPWTLTVAGTATATESPTGTLNLTGDGTNSARADKVFSTVPGATYKVSFTSSGSAAAAGVGTSQGNSGLASPSAVLGSGSFYFIATTETSWLLFIKTAAATTVVSNISVKLVAGAHASQPTSTKRPIYVSTAGGPGLQFDGVDDFLQTPIIVPGTDSAQVFAGVRKLSDAARAIVIEYATGFGGVRLEAPNSAAANYASGSRGTNDPGAAVASGYAAPNTAVLAGLGVVSSDTNILRVNGTQVATQVGDQGTGNYATAGNVLIGMRAGTSLPFNGILTELVMRFGPTPAADQIAAMESYINSKTVAY